MGTAQTLINTVVIQLEWNWSRMTQLHN